MTILTVEDNAEMRHAIKKSLFATARVIYECGDGTDAIEFYAKYEPDFVLMDISLPTLDGLKATRRILNRYPHAKIIIVTQHDDAELREEAELAGALDYVLKESLHELPEIIRKFDGFATE